MRLVLERGVRREAVGRAGGRKSTQEPQAPEDRLRHVSSCLCPGGMAVLKPGSLSKAPTTHGAWQIQQAERSRPLLLHADLVSQPISDNTREPQNRCGFLLPPVLTQEPLLWPTLPGSIQEREFWEM